MQLQIRPFQEEEIQRVSSRKRCGVIWHMGLGKTMCAATVGGRAHLRRWLVIAPTNAFSVWRDKAAPWIKLAWPESHTHVYLLTGGPDEREFAWKLPIDPNPNNVHIFVITVDSFLNDWTRRIKAKIPGKTKAQTLLELKPRKDFVFPQIVIFDEARRMRNRKSQAFKITEKFTQYYNVPYFLPMTGTPGNQPQHFYAMLSIIAPKVFTSFWRFVSTFHYVYDTPFGKEIGQIKNTESWHKLLNQYCSVVREDDPGINDQLPALQRLPLDIHLDDDQQKAYRALERDMLYVDADDVIVAQNILALTTRLRQILVCPKILGANLGVGRAIKDFAETVDPEDPGHYVVFTPFVAAMPHFQAYLESEGLENVFSLNGGATPSERDSILSVYSSAGQKKASIMLCSLLYAQAFSLEPATKCFFIGFDWDPDNNRQAEARLRRLTSDVGAAITAYYYNFPNCYAARNMYDIVVEKQERLNITIPSDLRNLFKPKSDQKIPVD